MKICRSCWKIVNNDHSLKLCVKTKRDAEQEQEDRLFELERFLKTHNLKRRASSPIQQSEVAEQNNDHQREESPTTANGSSSELKKPKKQKNRKIAPVDEQRLHLYLQQHKATKETTE